MKKEERKRLAVITPTIFFLFLFLELLFLLWGRHFYLTFWNNSNVAESASGYLGFLAAALSLVANTVLVLVTSYYVLANNELLRINSAQFERTQTIYLEFGLTIMPTPRGDQEVGAWVSNLGVTNFMVADVEYLNSSAEGDARAPQLWRVNRVIAAGQPTETLQLPRFYEAGIFGSDVQIRLRILFLGEEIWSVAKGYNILADATAPRRVKDGYDRARGFDCPVCKSWGLCYMSVDGVRTEAELDTRKQLYVSDMAASCPNHQSKYMLGNLSGA